MPMRLLKEGVMTHWHDAMVDRPRSSLSRSPAHLGLLLCFVHCCLAVGMAAVRAYLLCSFRKEECCLMRVHLERKPLDRVAIAFVVITLLAVVAVPILLSRLNAF
jgi:hypothetical protein